MTNKTNKSTPKRQNKKQLSLTAISKSAKNINTLKEHIWDVETNTVIRYYERFDNNKIEELLNELYEDISYADSEGLKFFQDDSNMMKYLSILIVKFFTHLNKTIPKEFEKKIAYMNEMLTIGLVEELFDKCFIDSEVYKVFSKVIETANLNEKLVNLELETGAKMKNFLSNSENMQQLQKLSVHKDIIHPLVHPDIVSKIDSDG